MALTRIDFTKANTDEDGRLVENYSVEADADENIETIIEAYGPDNARIPQLNQPNRFRQLANNPKMTYVDKIRVSHDGKDHNTYKVTVSYAPPEESGNSDDNNNVGPDYPWNDLTAMSQTGDIMMVASRGLDKAGQPWKYSNGGMIVTEVPVPITNINLTRKPLRSSRNSFDLSSEYFQTINDADVTIDGTGYPKHTLLVQAFDVERLNFKETDPNTGNVTLTVYQIENIVLSYNKFKWFEYVVDEGIMAKQQVTVNGTQEDRYLPLTDKATGNIITENVALNGEGAAIFDTKGDVVAPALTSGRTEQGVLRSSELSVANGSGAQTVLVMATYDEKSFSGLKLNEGL